VSELALLLVRIGFVVVLWIFIFSLLSVIRADIYGRRVIRSVAQQSGSQVASQVAPIVTLMLLAKLKQNRVAQVIFMSSPESVPVQKYR
jgi:hypothetical protein